MFRISHNEQHECKCWTHICLRLGWDPKIKLSSHNCRGTLQIWITRKLFSHQVAKSQEAEANVSPETNCVMLHKSPNPSRNFFSVCKVKSFKRGPHSLLSLNDGYFASVIKHLEKTDWGWLQHCAIYHLVDYISDGLINWLGWAEDLPISSVLAAFNNFLSING